jgi:hypothetical protein
MPAAHRRAGLGGGSFSAPLTPTGSDASLVAPRFPDKRVFSYAILLKELDIEVKRIGSAETIAGLTVMKKERWIHALLRQNRSGGY